MIKSVDTNMGDWYAFEDIKKIIKNMCLDEYHAVQKCKRSQGASVEIWHYLPDLGAVRRSATLDERKLIQR